MSLGELHLDAMKLLVAAHEKKKFAVADRPRKLVELSTTQPLQEAHPKSSRRCLDKFMSARHHLRPFVALGTLARRQTEREAMLMSRIQSAYRVVVSPAVA